MNCCKFHQVQLFQQVFFEPAFHSTIGGVQKNYWLYCALPIEAHSPQFNNCPFKGKWQRACIHRLLRQLAFREHLTDFRRHSLTMPSSISMQKRFRRRLHPRQVRLRSLRALDSDQTMIPCIARAPILEHRFTLPVCDLLSSAFPAVGLRYLLRLVDFVNEPCRSRPKRPSPSFDLSTAEYSTYLPTSYYHGWPYRVGKRSLAGDCAHGFSIIAISSLFMPKIRILKTRSSTLGDRTTTDGGNNDGAPALLSMFSL